MSANNQILIKEHKGKWYVFDNVMAESWVNEEGEINHLLLSDAFSKHDTRDEAYDCALTLEREHDTTDDIEIEYGVQFNRLCKDDAEVKIIED